MKSILARVLLLFPKIQEILLKASTYPRFYHWIQVNKLEKFIDGAPREKREKLYKYVCDWENLFEEKITYLEFGVHRGESLAWWAQNNTNPNSKFIGFDSFLGLPEDWSTSKKTGAFSTAGAVPIIDDPRVSFVKGWFHETIHRHLRIFDEDARRIIHLDADLYRSTIYPLLITGPYLKSGDILLFDEMHDSVHEYRAFEDFHVIFAFKYRVLGATKLYAQVAILIE